MKSDSNELQTDFEVLFDKVDSIITEFKEGCEEQEKDFFDSNFIVDDALMSIAALNAGAIMAGLPVEDRSKYIETLLEYYRTFLNHMLDLTVAEDEEVHEFCGLPGIDNER